MIATDLETMKKLKSFINIILMMLLAAGAVVLVVFMSNRGSRSGELKIRTIPQPSFLTSVNHF
jgi:flagellar basal body-associated protein FliL